MVQIRVFSIFYKRSPIAILFSSISRKFDCVPVAVSIVLSATKRLISRFVADKTMETATGTESDFLDILYAFADRHLVLFSKFDVIKDFIASYIVVITFLSTLYLLFD